MNDINTVDYMTPEERREYEAALEAVRPIQHAIKKLEAQVERLEARAEPYFTLIGELLQAANARITFKEEDQL